jgi:murein L,D-transpeptidase YafK
MEIRKGIIKIVVADEGMLLTQSGEVPVEERIFSSRIYDENLDNWTEWTEDDVEKFIQERQPATEVENGTL